MSRIKITEYRAKKLILGDAYQGISFTEGKTALPKTGRFVVKVDQGIKKRFKQGLVVLDVPAKDIATVAVPWKKAGFTGFIAEPMLPHEAAEEQYLSLERVRSGIRVLHAREGGVDIEAHPEKVKSYLIDPARPQDVPGIPADFLRHLLDVFEKNFFAFLEINPLVVRGNEVHLLDAAALVDSAGAFFVNGAWSEEDVVTTQAKHPVEKRVAALQKTTPASLKITVMNPNGSLFFLLSGGGGSIVIADEAALKGMGKDIGNYGEYSGGPTREETHLYTREVLSLVLASKAQRKALIIAGGVANFTDIKATFAGIIDALTESAEKLRTAGVKVFVRRGGPNEAAGLAHMREYLEGARLLGSIHGSDVPLTMAVDEAINFVRP